MDARPSPIAGAWYPGSASRLASEIDSYVSAATVEPVPGRLVAVMAPHAGYRYSGPVAGHAFKLLGGMTLETVAVVSPIHRPLSMAPAFTTAHQAYQTPLGTIPVNHDAIDALRAAGLTIEAVRMDAEHSLEIELPFLQRTLEGPFDLIPLMLHDQSAESAEHVGHALASVLEGRDALLVASTDLSHFYSQEQANWFDRAVLACVEAFDPAGVIELEATGKGFACGRGALAAVMWAARDLGADSAVVLNYATSGDTSGDYSRVVGYGAAALYRRTESA
jgi:hypothetical protein